jgi:EAL and modified HD-GYP domain-containing signal transduction protein
MSDIFIVRQPVFDSRDAAVGYELRFRDESGEGDPFARSYLSGAFDELRAGLPAYVRCTKRQLTDRIFHSADPLSLVVLLPPDIDAEESTLGAIDELQRAGVIMGVDEFDDCVEHNRAAGKLLDHVTFVRVDLRDRDLQWVGALAKKVRERGKRLIADHVIDGKTHRACVTLGFERFQGPHFSRPEPLPTAALPASTATAMRLLALARNPNTPERDLERAISTDPALTFQLLRLVNNAMTGLRGVESVSHALRLVGRNAFVRWLALAFATSRRGTTGADQELVRHAVQRARFCEQIGKVSRNRLDGGALFLVGLFSMLDAVFRMPLTEVLDRVSLSSDVRDALLDRTGPLADTLTLVETYEMGLWESAAEFAASMGLEPESLPQVYAESVSWASQQLATEKAAA